jgi:excisionase family DNA binding protein
MPNEVMTTAEVAKAAGVTAQAVRLWVASGRLKPWRTLATGHLFDSGDVAAFLAKRAA